MRPWRQLLHVHEAARAHDEAQVSCSVLYFTGLQRDGLGCTHSRVGLTLGTTYRTKLTLQSSFQSNTGDEQRIYYAQGWEDEWFRAVREVVQAGNDGSSVI
jgi:hypothetical protein